MRRVAVVAGCFLWLIWVAGGCTSTRTCPVQDTPDEMTYWATADQIAMLSPQTSEGMTCGLPIVFLFTRQK